MRTVTYGTLEEWSKFKPEAMLINRNIRFMSNGCYVQLPIKKDKPVKTTYSSISRPDGPENYADPFYLIGGCPYIIKAEHQHFVSVGTFYGAGTVYPISKYHWNDPNWEEIEKIEDCLIKD
jgi:hypothetical protein